MSSQRCDFELLQAFARQGDQGAFADVARRHIDLVFGTAMRKLEDHGAAQEVAQNVFLALARKAWRFAPDNSLPAWLHKTTLLECKSWLRGELRRRRREETAAELETTMKTPADQPGFHALLPLLDEALLSLREIDRTALLLRFCEDQSFREIASAFGLNEDAAQKRVERALARLSSFFARRGFKTASVSAAAAALKATAASTSAEVTLAVVAAALNGAPAGVTGLTAVLARFAALSKAQTAAACIVLGLLPVAWQWNHSQQVRKDLTAAQSTLATVRMQREEAAAETDRLRGESDRLASLRRAAASIPEANQQAALKLRSVRQRARAMLAADDYHWPDDLPFVRIPKSALRYIHMAGGPTTPTVLEAKVFQFLDLSASERQAAEQTFSNYFTGIDELMQTNLYETNQGTKLKLQPDAESKVFVLLPTGPAIRSALAQLTQNLLDTLGEDRWEMVRPDPFEFTHYEQVRLLGYTQDQWDQMQEVAVNIYPSAEGPPGASWTVSDGTGIGRVPLQSYASGRPHMWQGPPALVEAVAQYLAFEARKRLPPAAK